MPFPPRFKKTLLASLIGAALTPPGVWAATLDFAQAPPGTVEPYVAPNVILTLDDSTSMNANMYDSGTGANLGWRTTVLKNAVIDAFSDTTALPDGKIRLAWQTMGNCTSVSGSKWAEPLDATSATKKNVMRVFKGTHRANFITYMNNYTACTNTPTHDMVQRADQYMRAAVNINGPWASEPGVQSTPYLGCRRNYHILLTDGGWNGTERQTDPRNYDGATRTLPNGINYAATAQTRLYRDSEDYTTIADWAFKSWADPLQDAANLEGMVSPSLDYDQAPATETIKNRVTGATATLEKFWNPKYNPANWPHMVTFTIGFSNDALPKKNYNASESDKGAITPPTSVLPYGDDGSLAEYANGTYVWLARKKDKGHDMWHAALNSRGQFYAVEKGEDLKKAFQQIVKTINAETEPDRSATATSGSNASQNNVGVYTANYVPAEGWRGAISAEIFKADGSTEIAWSGKTTADLLDAAAFNVENRLVLSWSDVVNPATGKEKGGVAFKWASDETYLSTAQKTLLTAESPTGSVGINGQNRVDYLRGKRDLECPAAGCTTEKPFRRRWSRQGSIVNSDVWYVGTPVSNYALDGYIEFARAQQNRTPMLYVGGNDGMLHGFKAGNVTSPQSDDGAEKLAYVPRGVISELNKLTAPTFNQEHKYFVDGSPMTGDVWSGSSWRTLLVGTLGAGGKGYFVLDVTNPASFSEANASSLVVMDKTYPAGTTPVGNDAIDDLGHIFAKPVMDDTNSQRTTQIVRMNNDRWAVVMGNGYNSANGRPVLLIQYLDGAQELVRLIATGTIGTAANPCTAAQLDNINHACHSVNNNGLSAPRLVDINNDGRPDVVYAGDLKGNLWKFLIASAQDSEWGVAQWGSSAGTTSPTTTGTPLFTARRGVGYSTANAGSVVQPITTPPSVRVNDRTKTETTGSGPTAETKTVRVGGMMVAFGTGRNITKLDQAEQQQQTLYSVLDNTRYEQEDRPGGGHYVKACATTSGNCSKLVKTSDDLPKTVAQSELVERSIPENPEFTRTSDSKKFWTVDATDTLNWDDKKGWFMDLPLTRERLLKPMKFYDGSNLLAVESQIPAKGSRLDPAIESCEGGSVDPERQFLTLINIMDGKKPQVPLFKDSNDLLARTEMPPGALTAIAVDNSIHYKGRKQKENGSGTEEVTEEMRRMPEMTLRPNWRQLK